MINVRIIINLRENIIKEIRVQRLVYIYKVKTFLKEKCESTSINLGYIILFYQKVDINYLLSRN